MLKLLVGDPVLTGLLTAGVLAAIMSSLDSQFLCLGTIFTNDIVLHRVGPKKYSDKQVITIARLFIIAIVAITYGLAMVAKDANVFDPQFGVSAVFQPCFRSFLPLFIGNGQPSRGWWPAFWRLLSVGHFFHLSGYGGEYFVGPGIVPAAICFLVASVALVVVSFMTDPPSKETLKKFFPKLN